MDVGEVVSIIAALGLGGVGTQLIAARLQKQREKREIEGQAWRERDKEARIRRKLEEYAHELRRRMFRKGYVEGDGPDDVPPWPNYNNKD